MRKTSRQSCSPGLRPEAEILLNASSSVDAALRTANTRSVLEGDVDWDDLLRLSEHNRLDPLLSIHLNEIGSDLIPEHVLQGLRNSHRRTAVRNMHLAMELVQVLKILRSESVPALTYKGPLLTLDLFSNLGHRHFWDLDILVRKEDVLEVKSILVSRGYKPEKELSPREELEFFEKDNEYNFDRVEDGVHLEIHWNILPQPFSLTSKPDEFWNSTVTVPLLNDEVRTLPPEEMILVLSMHGGSKHQWGRLKWISDIARFIDVHEALDWKRILNRADELECKHALLEGIYLAHILLKSTVPEACHDLLRTNAKIQSEAGLVWGRLFRKDFGLPGFSEWRSYIRKAEVSSSIVQSPVSRVREYIRYVRAVIRPEFRDRYAMKLPRWLHFYDYIYRIWRMTTGQKTHLIDRLR